MLIVRRAHLDVHIFTLFSTHTKCKHFGVLNFLYEFVANSV